MIEVVKIYISDPQTSEHLKRYNRKSSFLGVRLRELFFQPDLENIGYPPTLPVLNFSIHSS